MQKKDVIIIILVVGFLSLVVFIWSVYFRPLPPSLSPQQELPKELTKEQILEALRGDTNVQGLQREEKVQILNSLRETGQENVVVEEEAKKNLLQSLKGR